MNDQQKEDSKGKKKAKPAPKKKQWGMNIEANRIKRAERHKKRMERQATKKMKVKRGTARMMNAPMRAARKAKDHAERTFWAAQFNGLAQRIQQEERERRVANAKAAKQEGLKQTLDYIDG